MILTTQLPPEATTDYLTPILLPRWSERAAVDVWADGRLPQLRNVPQKGDQRNYKVAKRQNNFIA